MNSTRIESRLLRRPWLRPLTRFFMVAMPALLMVFIIGKMLDVTGPDSTYARATSPAPGFYSSGALNQSGVKSRPSMSANEYQRRLEAIAKSANFLVGMCDDTGLFTYKINLDPDIKHDPGYNMLRHCGTIYALSMHQDLSPSDETFAVMLNATRFLTSNSIDGVPGESETMRSVWSHPELTHSTSPLQAKLGGSGLGLVAMCSVHVLDRKVAPLETIQGLGEFIRFMQKPDGSFYSKYIPSQGGRQDKWTSLYYPGEAALGLLMLYEIDPDPQWAQGAISALQYLATSREELETVPADHWALLATAKLLALAEKGATLEFDRAHLVAHAAQVCEFILSEQVSSTKYPLLMGGFATDGRTTPTSTRLEGLLAAMDILESNEHRLLKRRMERAIQQGILFLSNAQVHRGRYSGAFPRAMMQLPSDDSSEMRNFNRRATEVRIDYVQHAMSAMIQHLHLYGPTTTSAAHVGDQNYD